LFTGNRTQPFSASWFRIASTSSRRPPILFWGTIGSSSHCKDSGTSGAVLIAKNMLSGAVERESVTRIYYGITDRPVSFFRKSFSAPIQRELPEQPRRIVTPRGKSAVTHIFRVREKNGFTLLRFRLETGRTHQIRVHCAALGIPLVGDGLYGGTEGILDRPALHGAYLSLVNPVTGRRIAAKAPLAPDMRALII